MRLIVHGQQAFGKAVLEGLLSRSEDVIAVYCAPDVVGGRPDPLKQSAAEAGITVCQPTSYKDPVVQKEMAALGADLCVMAYVTLMIPEEVLNTPSMCSIQYHPSLLPMHKGPSSINWPIIFGEPKTGLSIFWPDKGLDTGPILLQKECPIGPDDTLGSLYFDRLFPLGVSAMMEAVDLVRSGKAPKVPQQSGDGSYEGWCRREEAQIDWSKSSQDVYNLIRGCDPQPGAWTVIGGTEVQLFGCSRVSNVSAAPGTLVSSEDGIVIATGGEGILVTKVRPHGGSKIDARKFLSASNVQEGVQVGG
jgi:methionyl-tRNA formyltransferase